MERDHIESPCYLYTDDEVPSVMTCPSDISTTSDGGSTNTTVTWPAPTFRDNSGNWTVSSNYDSPTVLAIGVWTVIYNATDLYGNVAQCSFVVTVAGMFPTTVSHCTVFFFCCSAFCGNFVLLGNVH